MAIGAVTVIAYPALLRDPEVAAAPSDDRASVYFGAPVVAAGFLIAGILLVRKHRNPHRPARPWIWGVGVVLVGAMTVMSATMAIEPGDDVSAAAPPTSQAPVTSQAPETRSTEEPVVRTFYPDMVKARGVSKQNKGGQSNVRFVAGTTNIKEIERLALECVEHFTEQTKAAYCYAYATQSDYDLKDPEWTPEFDASAYGGYRICWTLQAGQSLASDRPGIVATNTSITYDMVTHCPGGVKIPD